MKTTPAHEGLYLKSLALDAQAASSFLAPRPTQTTESEPDHTKHLSAFLTLIDGANNTTQVALAYMFLFADFAGGSIIAKRMEEAKKPERVFFTHLTFADQFKHQEKGAQLASLRSALEAQLRNSKDVNENELNATFDKICRAYRNLLTTEAQPGVSQTGVQNAEPSEKRTQQRRQSSTHSKKREQDGLLKTAFMFSGWHDILEKNMTNVLEQTSQAALHVQDKYQIISSIMKKIAGTCTTKQTQSGLLNQWAHAGFFPNPAPAKPPAFKAISLLGFGTTLALLLPQLIPHVEKLKSLEPKSLLLAASAAIGLYSVLKLTTNKDKQRAPTRCPFASP